MVETCPNGCSNKGTCDRENGLCECNNGWTGDDCSVKTCLNNCNDGKCFNGKCICKFGHGGKDCSERLPLKEERSEETQKVTKDIKCQNRCYGHGICFENKCYCFKGFSG